MTNQEAARKLFNIKHDDRFSWTQESVDAFDLAISALYDLVISSLEKHSKKSSDTRKDPGEPTSILDALLYPNQSVLEILDGPSVISNAENDLNVSACGSVMNWEEEE